MEAIAQLFGLQKPRSGKLVLTRYAFQKMTEHKLDRETLENAFRHGKQARAGKITHKYGDCSKDTGFIQPVHDGVRRGFVAGLRRGLHATYPAPGAPGSALASAPGRRSFASCDSAGCPAPPHARWRVVACHRET
jgi:hypothetical protein